MKEFDSSVLRIKTWHEKWCQIIIFCQFSVNKKLEPFVAQAVTTLCNNLFQSKQNKKKINAYALERKESQIQLSIIFSFSNKRRAWERDPGVTAQSDPFSKKEWNHISWKASVAFRGQECTPGETTSVGVAPIVGARGTNFLMRPINHGRRPSAFFQGATESRVHSRTHSQSRNFPFYYGNPLCGRAAEKVGVRSCKYKYANTRQRRLLVHYVLWVSCMVCLFYGRALARRRYASDTFPARSEESNSVCRFAYNW